MFHARAERRFNLLDNDVRASAMTSQVHFDPHRFRRAPRTAVAKVDVVRVQFRFTSSTMSQVCHMLVVLAHLGAALS